MYPMSRAAPSKSDSDSDYYSANEDEKAFCDPNSLDCFREIREVCIAGSVGVAELADSKEMRFPSDGCTALASDESSNIKQTLTSFLSENPTSQEILVFLKENTTVGDPPFIINVIYNPISMALKFRYSIEDIRELIKYDINFLNHSFVDDQGWAGWARPIISIALDNYEHYSLEFILELVSAGASLGADSGNAYEWPLVVAIRSNCSAEFCITLLEQWIAVVGQEEASRDTRYWFEMMNACVKRDDSNLLLRRLVEAGALNHGNVTLSHLSECFEQARKNEWPMALVNKIEDGMLRVLCSSDTNLMEGKLSELGTCLDQANRSNRFCSLTSGLEKQVREESQWIIQKLEKIKIENENNYFLEIIRQLTLLSNKSCLSEITDALCEELFAFIMENIFSQQHIEKAKKQLRMLAKELPQLFETFFNRFLKSERFLNERSLSIHNRLSLDIFVDSMLKRMLEIKIPDLGKKMLDLFSEQNICGGGQIDQKQFSSLADEQVIAFLQSRVKNQCIIAVLNSAEINVCAKDKKRLQGQIKALENKLAVFDAFYTIYRLNSMLVLVEILGLEGAGNIASMFLGCLDKPERIQNAVFFDFLNGIGEFDREEIAVLKNIAIQCDNKKTSFKDKKLCLKMLTCFSKENRKKIYKQIPEDKFFNSKVDVAVFVFKDFIRNYAISKEQKKYLDFIDGKEFFDQLSLMFDVQKKYMYQFINFLLSDDFLKEKIATVFFFVEAMFGTARQWLFPEGKSFILPLGFLNRAKSDVASVVRDCNARILGKLEEKRVNIAALLNYTERVEFGLCQSIKDGGLVKEQGQKFIVSLWDRMKPEACLLGGQLHCCLAPDGIFKERMIERILDPRIFSIVIKSNEREIVAGAWCCLLLDQDEELRCVVSGYDVNARMHCLENKQMYVERFFTELNKYIVGYARELGIRKRPVINPQLHNASFRSILKKVELNYEVLQFSSMENKHLAGDYYIEVIREAESSFFVM